MVDVDSEREKQVIFNKPNDFIMPTNPDEARLVIIEDLKTLAHGLGCLIRIAQDSGYGSADEMLNETIELLKDYYPTKAEDSTAVDDNVTEIDNDEGINKEES